MVHPCGGNPLDWMDDAALLTATSKGSQWHASKTHGSQSVLVFGT